MSERSLADLVEEAMNDFLGRLVRVQQISRVEAPREELRRCRESYLEGVQAKDQEHAHLVLVRCVRLVQAYRASIKNYDGPARRWWSQYEDQRLRKPIARLARLESESRKAEALRRLKSPPDAQSFFQPGAGAPVRMSGWTHRPVYDSVSLETKAQPVAHEVLVAAGLYNGRIGS